MVPNAATGALGSHKKKKIVFMFIPIYARINKQEVKKQAIAFN